MSDYFKITENGITLISGTTINNFSTDGTLAGNSDDAVPTEKAVKTYVDDNVDKNATDIDNLTGAFVTLSGIVDAKPEYCIYEEHQTTGDGGGEFDNGSWLTRILNTTVIDASDNISRSGNVITCAAGTYRIMATAPACRVAHHQARFYNTSDTSMAIRGTTAWSSPSAEYVDTRSIIDGVFTIAGTKNFELQHRCQGGIEQVIGFGHKQNFETTIYSHVYIEKIA